MGWKRVTFSGMKKQPDKAPIKSLRDALGNPVQRGHRFQRKADSNPVIADSR